MHRFGDWYWAGSTHGTGRGAGLPGEMTRRLGGEGVLTATHDYRPLNSLWGDRTPYRGANPHALHAPYMNAEPCTVPLTY